MSSCGVMDWVPLVVVWGGFIPQKHGWAAAPLAQADYLPAPNGIPKNGTVKEFKIRPSKASKFKPVALCL